MEIHNIAVIGAGNMGRQVSLCAALGGFTVTCTDSDQATRESCAAFWKEYMAGRVEKGKLSREQADAVLGRISIVGNLEDAVGNCDLAVEAVVEVLDVKRELFAEMDRLAPPHAILATNSSYIVSSRLADATRRPEKVCNMHFFNPALVMKLVEVVRGPHTARETAEAVAGVCLGMDKVPVHLSKEVPGFLVNRVVRAIYDEALWLYEMGVSSVEDIDNALQHGLGHPMGAFRLMDMTGIDLYYTMCMESFRESGDPAELPTPSLTARYLAGDYGQKTGKGWYDYGK